MLTRSGQWWNTGQLSERLTREDHLKCGRLQLDRELRHARIVALLKIQRTMELSVVFALSGRLDSDNVGELCQLITAIRHLRDSEAGDRVVLRNWPAYIRVWMAAGENP